MCLYDFVVFLSQIIDLSLNFEGIVHLKMKTMSSFNRPSVIPNMYDLLSSVEYIRLHFLCLNVFIHTMEGDCLVINILQNIQSFCVLAEERKSHVIGKW